MPHSHGQRIQGARQLQLFQRNFAAQRTVSFATEDMNRRNKLEEEQMENYYKIMKKTTLFNDATILFI